MRPVQTFSEEYLDHCKTMTPDQIARFLEDFRTLHSERTQTQKSILISMKVPPDLLQTFKAKCQLANTPYQTQIKKLMKDWLLG